VYQVGTRAASNAPQALFKEAFDECIAAKPLWTSLWSGGGIGVVFAGNLCLAGVTDIPLLTPFLTCGVLAGGSPMGLPLVADDSELAGWHEVVCPWHNRDKEASYRPE
jgi:hypothetical protein